MNKLLGGNQNFPISLDPVWMYYIFIRLIATSLQLIVKDAISDWETCPFEFNALTMSWRLDNYDFYMLARCWMQSIIS